MYLIKVNGEKLLLCKADCDDMEIRDSSWKNGALTVARHAAEKYSKFYGVKPVRMENNKVVPRSLNYSHKTRTQLGL